ncbi:MAG: DUF3224 domain-containing protein [Bryobacteraceae bacterium]
MPPKQATGEFEVKLTPLPTDASPAVARMSIDKTFHGGLAGSSKGEMLASQGAVKGSAGYVAMERVAATLAGRSGSFVLQHSGAMERGQPTAHSVTVVPDSGAGQLEGLAGTMEIIIEGGRHSYRFEYTLP